MDSIFSLKNKTIVITGALGLIGKKCAEICQTQGASVIGLDINTTTDQIIEYKQLDITNAEQIQAFLNTITLIDGWVNCAYPKSSDWLNPIESRIEDHWRENIELQLNSHYLCSQKVLHKMQNQKQGVLINIASIYGFLAPRFSLYQNNDLTVPVAYSAIKGGMINLTKYLASFYAKYNIRINCISPGGVYNNQDATFIDAYIENVPLNRMATPQDIAGSVAFLLSDAASYITGQNLVVDGGYSII